MAEHDPDWMWQRARAMLEQSERLRQRSAVSVRSDAQPTAWEPPVDIFETAEEFWVLVALPGVEAPQVQVHLLGSELVVLGQRPLPEVLRAAQVHRLEIPYGRFERRLSLPPGHYSLGVSQCVQGLVVLQIKKQLPAQRP